MKVLHNLKFGLISIMLMLGLALPVFVAGPVGAQIDKGSKDAACEGLGSASGQGCDEDASGIVGGLLATAVNILSWIIGIVAIFMVIIGGFKFVISGGDSAGVQSARNTIIYALVGLVVAALAQVMVRFVLRQAT